MWQSPSAPFHAVLALVVRICSVFFLPKPRTLYIIYDHCLHYAGPGWPATISWTAVAQILAAACPRSAYHLNTCRRRYTDIPISSCVAYVAPFMLDTRRNHWMRVRKWTLNMAVHARTHERARMCVLCWPIYVARKLGEFDTHVVRGHAYAVAGVVWLMSCAPRFRRPKCPNTRQHYRRLFTASTNPTWPAYTIIVYVRASAYYPYTTNYARGATFLYNNSTLACRICWPFRRGICARSI